MAQNLVPDLAQLYGQATNVAQNQLQLQEAQRAIARRQALEEAIRSAYTPATEGKPGYFEAPTGRTVPAVPGTPGGIDESRLVANLSQVAPTEALTIQNQIKSGAANHIQAGLMMTRYAGALAKDVGDQASWDAYKQTLKSIGYPDNVLAVLPDQYDPQTVKQIVDKGANITEADVAKSLAEAKGKFGIDVELANVKGGIAKDTALTVEEARARHAKELETQKEKAKTAATGKESKAADANSIRAATAALYGGTYDPMSGTIAGLSKTAAAQALDVAAKAEQIFLKAKESGKPILHNEAVRQAAQAAGIQFPGQAAPGSAPGGSFNYIPGQGLVPVAPGA